LQRLSDACQPATFGRNREDVLDEGYRLARKMDAQDFSINIGFDFSELLGQAVASLLRAENSDKRFRAELYKLNVYGPGSFFMTHKDTPRADSMFGSLVLALPTEHQGGTLVLRDNNDEYKFESSQSQDSSFNSDVATVLWAAFYGQVDHEVLPVISGYRVTLTFNLYFSDSPFHPLMSNVVPEVSGFRTALQNCLKDPTFLPLGGLLGFGLKHAYPMSAKSDVQKYVSYLKGTDCTIVEVANALGLSSYLRVVYDLSEIGNEDSDVWYYDQCVRETGGDDPIREYGYAMSETESDDTKAISDETLEDTSAGASAPVINWITMMNRDNSVETSYINWGNESVLFHLYGKLNLIVEIPPLTERGLDI
ncbi:hypothetical protein SISNIDRAFT_418419, partial [Sistotremastrum niveocremeum HHB9708]